MASPPSGSQRRPRRQATVLGRLWSAVRLWTATPAGGTTPAAAKDEAVPLTTVENSAFAELLVAELRKAGVAAFYKVMGGAPYSSTLTAPWAQCDVFVMRHDLERAREVLPSAHANAHRAHHQGRS